MIKLLTVIATAAVLVMGCASKGRLGDDAEVPLEPKQASSDSLTVPGGLTLHDKHPEQIYEKSPEYPPKARLLGFEGYVIVLAYVDERGEVKDAVAKECSLPGVGFEEAAVKAAFDCKYRPAEHKLKKVGCWVQYRVNFALE